MEGSLGKKRLLRLPTNNPNTGNKLLRGIVKTATRGQVADLKTKILRTTQDAATEVALTPGHPEQAKALSNIPHIRTARKAAEVSRRNLGQNGLELMDRLRKVPGPQGDAMRDVHKDVQIRNQIRHQIRKGGVERN